MNPRPRWLPIALVLACLVGVVIGVWLYGLAIA